MKGNETEKNRQSVPMSRIAEDYMVLRPQIAAHCGSIVALIQDMKGVFGVQVEVASMEQVIERLELARQHDPSRTFSLQDYPLSVGDFARIRARYLLPGTWRAIHDQVMETCNVEGDPVGGANLNVESEADRMFSEAGITVEHENCKYPVVTYRFAPSFLRKQMGITLRVENILDSLESSLVRKSSEVPAEWGRAAQDLMLGFDRSFRKISQMLDSLHQMMQFRGGDGQEETPAQALDQLAGDLAGLDLDRERREQLLRLVETARKGFGTLGTVVSALSAEDTSEIPQVTLRPVHPEKQQEESPSDESKDNRESPVVVHEQDEVTINLGGESPGILKGMENLEATVSLPRRQMESSFETADFIRSELENQQDEDER